MYCMGDIIIIMVITNTVTVAMKPPISGQYGTKGAHHYEITCNYETNNSPDMYSKEDVENMIRYNDIRYNSHYIFVPV